MKRIKQKSDILSRIKHAGFQDVALNGVGVFSGLVLLMLGINYVLIAMEHASIFTGYPADGIFQLFNPLRRLDAGQTAGHAFQFFHGLGTLFMHYPIYWLAGNDLSGVELSRWILSPALFFFTSLLIFWAITKRWHFTLFFTVILTLLAPIFFVGLIETGNSYIGVRSFMPLLLFSLLLLWRPQASQRVKVITKNICIGICLALSFFISTEHGLALIFAYAVATAAFYPDTSLIGRLKEVAFTAGVTAISLMSIYLVVSGKYFLEPIKYAINDVPSDQFWYFGAPPSRVVSSIGDIFVDPGLFAILITALLLLSALIYRFRIKNDYTIYVALLGIIYGLLSTVGMLANYGQGYTSALFRVEIIIFLGILFYCRKSSVVRDYRFSNGLLKLGAIFIILSLSVIIFNYAKSDLKLAPATLAAWKHKNGDMFGEKLSPQWESDLAITTAILKSNKGIVWSEYAGLPEAATNQYQPSGYDYIIHALGAYRRQEYIDRFDNQKPEFVITMRRDTYVPWQNWLENENWPFFQRIANNYRLAGRTSYSNIWIKENHEWLSDSKMEWKTVPFSQTKTNNLKLEKDGLIEVKLKYSAGDSLSAVPVLGKLPRYLVIPQKNQNDGLGVSLSPYMHEITFPIYVHKGDEVNLKTEVTHKYLGSDLEVRSVQYRMLESTGATAFYEYQ